MEIYSKMTEITEQKNLNPHYTTTPKIEIPQHVVVKGPETIPKVHVFNDADANQRLNAINQDIFEDSKKIPKKTKKKKFFGLF